jgi:hypothetical protein
VNAQLLALRWWLPSLIVGIGLIVYGIALSTQVAPRAANR